MVDPRQMGLSDQAAKAYLHALSAYQFAPTNGNYWRVMEAADDIMRIERWYERENRMPTLSQQAQTAAVKQVQAEKPSQFTVGAVYDGKVNAYATYDRKWSNGWGVTAYAKAWWNDDAVIPQRKIEGAAGIELSHKF